MDLRLDLDKSIAVSRQFDSVEKISYIDVSKDKWIGDAKLV